MLKDIKFEFKNDKKKFEFFYKLKDGVNPLI